MRSRELFLVGVVMAALPAGEARAQDYNIRFAGVGLVQPVGLTASALGDNDTLYFTEMPQAAQGFGTSGSNTVSKLTISTLRNREKIM